MNIITLIFKLMTEYQSMYVLFHLENKMILQKYFVNRSRLFQFDFISMVIGQYEYDSY